MISKQWLIRLGLALFLLISALNGGCGGKDKSTLIVQKEYVVLSPPDNLLRHRDPMPEPQSKSRRALVDWQVHTTRQLLDSNADKDEIKKWVLDTKALWETKNTAPKEQ